MVSPTPHSRSSSPVEVILLDTSSSDSDQPETRNLIDQTTHSSLRSHSISLSDFDDWPYQDDLQLDSSEHEEDNPSFFSILSRAFSSGSLSWQTFESLYGNGLRGASTRTWAPIEGRRRLRSDHRVSNQTDFVPTRQQIEDIFTSPAVPKREETRKGFSRSFELDIGGFIDSSSDGEDNNDEEEKKAEQKEQSKNEKAQAIHIDQDEDEQVGDVRSSLSVAPEVCHPQGDSNNANRLSLTERSSSDDSIYVVESNGLEHSLPSGPASSPEQVPSSSHIATTTSAAVPERMRRHKQPREQVRRPPRIQQYGLSFGCSSCLRPLLQRASGPDRKIYVLSCGHLVDGYCLVRLCAHPDSTFPFVYPSSTTVEFSEGSSKDKKKPKSKVKLPRIPVKSRSYEWFCPVEGCEQPHQSTLDAYIDEQSGEVGMFLEGPQWYWRPLMGGVEGVRLLFI